MLRQLSKVASSTRNDGHKKAQKTQREKPSVIAFDFPPLVPLRGWSQAVRRFLPEIQATTIEIA